MHVANAGDCEVVLAREVSGQVEAIPLTCAHGPDKVKMPGEVERIKATGALVMPRPDDEEKIPRIWSRRDGCIGGEGLAVSRSIGNFNLRDCGVIPDPEVIHFPLSANDKFICLATDGLHDCLRPKQMVARVTDLLKEGSNGCDELIDESGKVWETKFPGTYVDDATLMVCSLASPSATTPLSSRSVPSPHPQHPHPSDEQCPT